MKKKLMISALLMLLAAALFAGCGSAQDKSGGEAAAYRTLSADEAKELMDNESDYMILDVRTSEEYDEGHIPGAVLLPVTELSERASELLTDKDQLLLVYCRSGNRSKKAAETLAELGYTNVVDFGGIRDWKYDIEK